MYHLTDEELVLKVKSGANEAIGLLYNRYKGTILAYLYNNTRSKVASEDLLQVTFEKMIRYLQNAKKVEKFKPWIFTIARNVFIDHYHKSNKLRTTEWKEEKLAQNNSLIKGEDSEKEFQLHLLQKALAKLSYEKRELISMVKLNGMIYKDAAEIYETTEANIKVKAFRIMKELKIIMAEIQPK